MTLWSEVGVGDVVRGAKDKQAWEVLDRKPNGEVTIKKGEREHTFTPSGEVELIATRDELLAAAQAAVKVTMPGSLTVAQLDTETKLYTCPRTFPDAGSIQAHLYVLHGQRSEQTNVLDILSEHTTLHEQNKQSHPHIHSKDFWKENS